MPVVEELQLQPLPDGYVDYLRLKLQPGSESGVMFKELRVRI